MWLEEKRYPEDQDRFFKLDIPGLDVELILKGGSYFLNCDQLDIKMVEVHEILTVAKEFGLKLVTYELNKTIHKYKFFLARIESEKKAK